MHIASNVSFGNLSEILEIRNYHYNMLFSSDQHAHISDALLSGHIQVSIFFCNLVQNFEVNHLFNTCLGNISYLLMLTSFIHICVTLVHWERQLCSFSALPDPGIELTNNREPDLFLTNALIH